MIRIESLFLFLVSICKLNALRDIEDYTFYFNSYLYEFAYNDNIILNNDEIKIEFSNTSFIINDDITLNWNVDEDWTEISYIYASNNNKNIVSSDKSRRLLDDDNDEYTAWNKFDHTTEHHMRSGRFRGESKYKRQYSDARAMCHEFYAELASIHDATENLEVKVLCEKLGHGSCWIGLQMNSKDQDWKSTNKWLDGHPLGYTNWAPGEPNNYGGDEKCAEIYKNGEWNDLPCNRERYTICEKVIEHMIGEYVGVYKKTSWFKGNLYCKMKYGSELATITKYWQQQDAQTACSSIGNKLHSEDCWIGFKKKYGTLWEWVGNNELVTYTNWGLKQPSNDANKQCAFLNTHQTSGVWQSDECGKKKFIICNKMEASKTMQLKDLLFPPSQQEQYEKQQLIKKTEETELAEKKTEQQLAKEREKKQKEKAEKIGEDHSELQDIEDLLNINNNKKRYDPFNPKRTYSDQNSETMDEMKMESHHPIHSSFMNGMTEIKPAAHGGSYKERYFRMKQRLQRLQQRMNGMGYGNKLNGKGGNVNINGKQTGLTIPDNSKLGTVLQGFVKGLMGQPGQGNVNNMAKQNYFHHPFDTKGYNPMHDPFFGQMNMKHMKGFKGGYNNNNNNGNTHKPPSGDPNDPYGFNGGGGGGTQFNPQFYPQTQIPGPYAGMRRRRILLPSDDAILPQQIEKCIFQIKYELCIQYDVIHKKISFDVMMADKKQLKTDKDDNNENVMRDRENARNQLKLSKNNDIAQNIAYNIWKYERMDYKNSFLHNNDDKDVVKYGEFDDVNVGFVHYFGKIEFLFEFNPYKISHKLCRKNDVDALPFNVCLEKETKEENKGIDITLFVDRKQFDFKTDNEWDEIYTNINKKCLYLSNGKVCMMPIVDFTDYMVEIKIYKQH